MKENKDKFKEVIACDYYRNKGKEIKKLSILKVFLRRRNDPMKFIYCFRCAQWFYDFPILKNIFHKMYLHYSNKYNIEISVNTKIGSGLRIPHWAGGIVIHENAILGRNCEIMQGVTIGNNIMKSRKDVATIGDNVILGAGSKIIGNISIGSNVFVGANAVVVKDIPSNSCVGGVPSKILKSNFKPIIINEI